MKQGRSTFCFTLLHTNGCCWGGAGPSSLHREGGVWGGSGMTMGKEAGPISNVCRSFWTAFTFIWITFKPVFMQQTKVLISRV